MSRNRFATSFALVLVLALVGAACGGEEEQGTGDVQTDVGVDLENKVLTIGALNDESGPAAIIGKPFALGKRMLAAQINAGGSGFLPEGWTVQIVERDHGYNPSSSVQYYNEIKDQVLFIATSFGTPNTLPLQPLLAEDDLVAFPASLSSQMAINEYTPPIGAPYTVEAMRAIEWAIEDAGGAEAVQAGIVYNQDDYGEDGLSGFRDATSFHSVAVASEQAITPTQSDFTATVTALQDAGATHVVLTTLPTATIGILGTAASLGYDPIWIGNTPSWVDAFANTELLPLEARANFYWASSLPTWREDVPAIEEFHDAFAKYGGGATPNFYTLASYLQGLVAGEAFRRALDNGDATRAGYLEALRSISDFDANGLFQTPVDLTNFPYVTGTDVRILQPGTELQEWNLVSDYATPEAYQG